MPALLAPLIGWVLGPFLSFAKGLGQNIGALAAAALKNPYVLGALVASAFFVVIQHEEAEKAKLRAQAVQAVAGCKADFNKVLGANATLLQSLNWQTGQVRALARASAQKTQAAKAAQDRAQRATDAAAAIARHVQAYVPPKGSSDAQAALDILKGRAD